MRRALAAALALALAVLLLPASPALAARAELTDIEDEVMCTTCKIPLNIAEGPQPDREREFIRTLIAQGKTKEQVKQALVAEYGPQVLALPEEKGFGLTAYAIPVALFAVLLAVLALLVPRWRRAAPDGPAAAAAAPPALDDRDAARLDADLARYEA